MKFTCNKLSIANLNANFYKDNVEKLQNYAKIVKITCHFLLLKSSTVIFNMKYIPSYFGDHYVH